jgi:bifunctional N-acetylglucosamine-1-phosphate-uridyltransferase/glucosamine-1-phosphate-acetyltransferase GlmU-like protein
MNITRDSWEASAAPAIDPLRWTALIPAAGRGSRLGFPRPKILYPVAGRMIVEWLLDFLQPICSAFVFVLSPEGRDDVERELDALIPGRYRTVIQQVPTGMGDAVELGLSVVATPQVAIVWGDQVGLRRRSVEACFRLHDGPLQPDLTCPTVIRPNPYIHFDRDPSGRIAGLRQKREGDVMPAEGESDTGFFCFRTEALRLLLSALRTSASPGGAATGEFNFLPVIPLAAQRGVVLTPPFMTIEETVGVNSGADAALAEEFLRKQ